MNSFYLWGYACSYYQFSDGAHPPLLSCRVIWLVRLDHDTTTAQSARPTTRPSPLPWTATWASALHGLYDWLKARHSLGPRGLDPDDDLCRKSHYRGSRISQFANTSSCNIASTGVDHRYRVSDVHLDLRDTSLSLLDNGRWSSHAKPCRYIEHFLLTCHSS